MAWGNSPINEFLDLIKNLSLDEMLEKAKSEKDLVALEIRNYAGNRDYPDFKAKMKYYGNLKGFIFFLEKNEQSETVYPPVFMRFEWIARKLVKRGDLNEEVLDLFD